MGIAQWSAHDGIHESPFDPGLAPTPILIQRLKLPAHTLSTGHLIVGKTSCAGEFSRRGCSTCKTLDKGNSIVHADYILSYVALSGSERPSAAACYPGSHTSPSSSSTSRRVAADQ